MGGFIGAIIDIAHRFANRALRRHLLLGLLSPGMKLLQDCHTV